MTPLDDKSDNELLRSLLAEAAKSQNEIRCARADLEKAHGRIGFLLLLINTLLERQQGD